MPSPAKLMTVLKCGQAWEAEIVRDRLESAGLLVFVQGSESATSLSYVGVALGGVRVQVPADQIARAKELLALDERQRETAGPWECPRCDEPNDAGFDFCYSCSMPRGETPASSTWYDADFEEEDTALADPLANDGVQISQRASAVSVADEGNPYQYLGDGRRAVSKMEMIGSEIATSSARRTQHAGELVSQAMRWAVIGVFLPMPLFHLISIGVLTQAGSEGAWRVARLRRKAMLVLALDLVLLVGTTLILIVIIFG